MDWFLHDNGIRHSKVKDCFRKPKLLLAANMLIYSMHQQIGISKIPGPLGPHTYYLILITIE